MFFWRKGKDAGHSGKAAAKGPGKPGAKGGAGAPAKAASKAQSVAAGKASAAKGAKGQAPAAKGNAPAAKGKAATQSRAEAEAQMLRMLKDGSFEKNKKMAAMRDAGEIFEAYPDEAARLLRDWMNETKK